MSLIPCMESWKAKAWRPIEEADTGTVISHLNRLVIAWLFIVASWTSDKYELRTLWAVCLRSQCPTRRPITLLRHIPPPGEDIDLYLCGGFT